jgi:hypothetical protein
MSLGSCVCGTRVCSLSSFDGDKQALMSNFFTAAVIVTYKWLLNVVATARNFYSLLLIAAGNINNP